MVKNHPPVFHRRFYHDTILRKIPVQYVGGQESDKHTEKSEQGHLEDDAAEDEPGTGPDRQQNPELMLTFQRVHQHRDQNQQGDNEEDHHLGDPVPFHIGRHCLVKCFLDHLPWLDIQIVIRHLLLE